MEMERIWVVWLTWAAMVGAELRGLSGCMLKERLGLVALWKAMPSDQSTALPSQNDCCLWDGVNCSATTGRVQRLTLLHPPIVAGPQPIYFLNISLLLPFEELLEFNLNCPSCHGLINQQDLMKLSRLEKLSMTRNNLSNIVSLQAFANMKNLKYLDLSVNDMNIDLQDICKMKTIITLDLSSNAISSHLPPCIGNLTQLQLLNLDYNRVSGNIPSTIGNLPHLSSLSLQENYFSGSFSLHFLANNSKLDDLKLSCFSNDFQVETETQSWIPSFQLKNLILQSCNLNKMSNSVIPSFLLHQSELRSIDLFENNLQDTFPSWLLQNNSKLQSLLLSFNSLTGNLILPNFIHGLDTLVISNNKIGGKLPDNLQVFLPALTFLFLFENRFEGYLPSSFGALAQLRQVDLSFNSFTGKLPKTLFANNGELLEINFSNNLLEGEIYLNLTAQPSLNILDLSSNKFSGSIEELTLPTLSVLDVSNNLISGKLPKSLDSFSLLNVLVVSNNSFEGRIPNKLCHMIDLVYLDMSNNNFSGSIPSCFRTSLISFLYLRNCSLSGAIPQGLFSKSTLINLDLSYNDFSHNVLPNWIFSQRNLTTLLTAGINLEGEISTLICGLEKIKIMDLSHNNFNGTIPSCLFTRPLWVGESQGDYIESVLRSLSIFYVNPSKSGLLGVEFTAKGISITLQGSILNLMTGLDVSSNELSGQIPRQIGDSKTIHALNLSNNRLWGSIPDSISKLKEIESLDLSSNNLSGEIPSEIVRLNFLSAFNVSNNNLSGPVPNSGQFSNFDERNYGGNELLCGPRLPRLCASSASPPTTLPDEQGNDDETMFEKWSFWWSFVAAYVAAVISVVVVIGIDTRCSRVWFRAVDVVCSKLLCVFAKLKLILGIK